ncbi:MAG: tyrosine-type recombinase/integrase [Gemmataceae bacterium]|nr:tyrosine-type recombinase/integrase [Gemmataceae bacterium]
MDLEAAGIPYVVEGPDGQEFADFHALRHSYLTMLGRHGVDLRTAQELAGQSSPILTARYSHRRLYDLAGVVDKLPNLFPIPVPTTSALPEELPLRLTGTDEAAGVPPGVPSGYAERHSLASNGNLRIVGSTGGDVTQTLEMKGTGASLHRSASLHTEWAVPGLNRGPNDFQDRWKALTDSQNTLELKAFSQIRGDKQG